MARDIAAVLTRLVGVAEDHVLDGVTRDGVPCQQFPDHMGSEIVWSHRSQCTTVAAEGRTQPRKDISIEHGSILNVESQISVGSG